VEHYPLFVLTGLAAWAFFQAAVQSGSGSLVANSAIIKKVWFPREVIPASVVVSQVVTLCVMFAVILPVNLIVVPETRATVLLGLPILAGLFCLTLGFSWALASANVFFRDVEHLLAILFLPWFFLTPVFYDLEQLPGASEHAWLIDVLRYGNPVTPYVETLRGAVLQGVVAGPTLLAYVFIVGPAFALVGLWLFQRHEERFAIEL
jgi:ABC-2 type transport system permease protein